MRLFLPLRWPSFEWEIRQQIEAHKRLLSQLKRFNAKHDSALASKLWPKMRYEIDAATGALSGSANLYRGIVRLAEHAQSDDLSLASPLNGMDTYLFNFGSAIKLVSDHLYQLDCLAGVARSYMAPFGEGVPEPTYGVSPSTVLLPVRNWAEPVDLGLYFDRVEALLSHYKGLEEPAKAIGNDFGEAASETIRIAHRNASDTLTQARWHYARVATLVLPVEGDQRGRVQSVGSELYTLGASVRAMSKWILALSHAADAVDTYLDGVRHA